MPFKKGHSKMGGRPPGSENKVTSEMREVLSKCLSKELTEEKFAYHLSKVEPSQVLNTLSRLLPYVLPKQTYVEGGLDLSVLSPAQSAAIIKEMAKTNTEPK